MLAATVDSEDDLVQATLLILPCSRQREGEEMPADLDQIGKMIVSATIVGLVEHDNRQAIAPTSMALHDRGRLN
jgi:hypothetical protein